MTAQKVDEPHKYIAEQKEPGTGEHTIRFQSREGQEHAGQICGDGGLNRTHLGRVGY